jgi:DNA transformation protein
MASTKQFRDRVLGRLLPFGPVTARAMFGGYGLYLDGAMFALIAGDALYFKCDARNRETFARQGGGPFTYSRRGRIVEMSYWQAPDAVMDDPARLCEWAGLAVAAARRRD